MSGVKRNAGVLWLVCALGAGAALWSGCGESTLVFEPGQVAYRAERIVPSVTVGVFGRVRVARVSKLPHKQDDPGPWLSGRTVYAYRAEPGTGETTAAAGRAETDERGFYEIELPPGRYFVSLFKAGALVAARNLGSGPPEITEEGLLGVFPVVVSAGAPSELNLVTEAAW